MAVLDPETRPVQTKTGLEMTKETSGGEQGSAQGANKTTKAKLETQSSCDSGFSTDSDELSFSGDESLQASPVVSPEPKSADQSAADQSELDPSQLPLNRSWTWYYLN